MKQKIKIPDGYEIYDSKHYDFNEMPGPHLIVPLKKKEPEKKSFDDYIVLYLDSVLNKYIEFFISHLEKFPYSDWPFEFRIGLFKFICEDLFDFNLKQLLLLIKMLPDAIGEKGSINDMYTEKIRQICPKEFIETFKDEKQD